MNKDKLLKKTLRAKRTADLHYGFENQAMSRIFIEAKKHKKRTAVLSLCLLSSVSLAMIAGLLIVLKIYFLVDFSIKLPNFHIFQGSGQILGFYIYIALIVLALLALDTYFRRLKKKSH
jgi:hypothetical protein